MILIEWWSYFEGDKTQFTCTEIVLDHIYISIEFTLRENYLIGITVLCWNICYCQYKILFLQISVKLALLVGHQKNSICNSKIIDWCQQIFKYNAVIPLLSQKEIMLLLLSCVCFVVNSIFGFFFYYILSEIHI